MDINRADAIMNSTNTVDVTYNGNKIYMDRIDKANKCCEIHFIDQPVTKLNVPLSELEEQ